MGYHITIDEAITALKKENVNPFTLLLKSGSMSIEYFAPTNVDTQQPHTQDEIYVIASGSSQFYRSGEIINCNKNDVLFVPARHRASLFKFYRRLCYLGNFLWTSRWRIIRLAVSLIPPLLLLPVFL